MAGLWFFCSSAWGGGWGSHPGRGWAQCPEDWGLVGVLPCSALCSFAWQREKGSNSNLGVVSKGWAEP